jgi:hypothetical protein
VSSPTDTLETIGRHLSAEVLRKLAEHLEGIEGPARSEIVVHHGPDGIGRGMECHKRLKTVDVRAPGSVGSAR